MSDKKRRQLREEDKCREIIRRRSLDRCEACPRLHTGPVRRGTDKHEILTRARGGDPTDPNNCMWVDRLCHDWITEHPAEAAQLGLVRHAWEGPPPPASGG